MPKVWKGLQVQTSIGEQACAIGDVDSPEEQSRGTATTSTNGTIEVGVRFQLLNEYAELSDE